MTRTKLRVGTVERGRRLLVSSPSLQCVPSRAFTQSVEPAALPVTVGSAFRFIAECRWFFLAVDGGARFSFIPT